VKLSLRARLALSFAGAVAAALLVFGAAVGALLVQAERLEMARTGIDTGDLYEDLRRVGWAMAVLLPVAAVGAAALGVWLAGRAVAPLREANARALSARASELDLTLPLRGAGDEWDQLAATLNALLADGRRSLERIRRFTSDAAHELRTPLTAILGEAEVTLRRERSAGELRAALTVVREEAARLAALVEALLSLARADAKALLGARVPCDLAELARAAKGDIFITGAAPPVLADRVLLQRALGNLIENGVRHGGGEVRVELSSTGGQARALVKDSGPGIPPQLQPILFERFARGDAARTSGGVGLGLSLARAIAEAHGGSLQLLPSDKGAAFELLLPL
jgi:two-component system heavy metal sensor histidine kinase CusS